MPPVPLNAPQGVSPVGGVQPGQSNAIVVADKVIVFGPGAGMFVYSGTPALGNPPIFWATSATVDPYGNPIPESSTAGIAGSGIFAAGNTLVTPAGTFVYSGTPALGNLIASITPAAGTDLFGNTYVPGTVSYFGPIAAGAYLALQNYQSVISWQQAPSANGAYALIGNIAGTIAPGVIDTITVTVTDFIVNATLAKLIGTTVEHDLSGNLIDYTSNATGSPLLTETSGDGNTYHIGNFATRDNGVPHLINSTTPIVTLTIGNLAANKGYHIHGFVTYLGNQAAGAPIFSWGAAGGLVLGAQQNGWQDISGGGVAPVIHNNDGALASLTGPAFAANTTNWLYRFEVYVTVNTGGQLQVTAAEGTAGDSFTIHQAYAMVEEY